MLKKVFIFALGATAGSLVTWKLIDEKYKKLAEEEIQSVVEYYENKEKCEEHIEKVVVKESDKNPWGMNYAKPNEEKEEYNKQVEDLGYTTEIFQTPDGIEVVPSTNDVVRPYVIAPEEFGEFGSTRCLTYYSDFVLVDEDNDIVIDPEALIGDALAHFGEYEDDCVHVRNESLEIDFEILKSEDSFTEINKEDN